MGTRVDNLEERIYELEQKNKKLVKALKMYADYNFYNVKFDIYKSPLTNREEIYRTWILDKKGRIISNRAQKVLKKVGEEE